MKKRLSFVALLATFALVAVACGDDDVVTTVTTATTTTAPTTTTEGVTTTIAEPVTALACQVSDVAGIDDKSFNETAWAGMEQAQAELGVSIEFLESTDATDYRPNIDAFIEQGCDVIITVGFLLSNDTAAAATDNPEQLFAIIDYPVFFPGDEGPFFIDPFAAPNDLNVRGLTFATAEAAFLAGYLSAGQSASHVIGTFGGINIPPVVDFMEGFLNGAVYYDSIHATTTTVLGWNHVDGLFTGNFDSQDDGRTFATNLMDEGADVILPVAGPVGLGSCAAINEANAAGASVMMIGVDADQFFSAPECSSILLTSIQKHMDAAMFNTVQNVLVLGTLGNQYNGTLANGGVGIAPFHDFEGAVSAELAAELVQLEADIVSGAVSVAAPEAEG